ncbi:MAG TPA: tetratricopeptide repeat protein, partial [Pseudolabrys sp.]|nr:tetratricopeptide repeat protein [Pseudolabrys sp.]
MSKPQPKPGPSRSPAEALRQAVLCHQRGELSEAEALYLYTLDSDPDNFDALHLYGVLKHQRGNHADALNFIARALKTNARSAAAHSHYGTVLAMLGRA